MNDYSIDQYSMLRLGVVSLYVWQWACLHHPYLILTLCICMCILDPEWVRYTQYIEPISGLSSDLNIWYIWMINYIVITKMCGHIGGNGSTYRGREPGGAGGA